MTAPTINVIEEMARRLPRWHLQASCRDAEPDLFFVERGTSTEAAKAICGACGVRETCLEWALVEYIDEGVMGGLSGKERRKLARERGRPRQPQDLYVVADA